MLNALRLEIQDEGGIHVTPKNFINCLRLLIRPTDKRKNAMLQVLELKEDELGKFPRRSDEMDRYNIHGKIDSYPKKTAQRDSALRSTDSNSLTTFRGCGFLDKENELIKRNNDKLAVCQSAKDNDALEKLRKCVQPGALDELCDFMHTPWVPVCLWNCKRNTWSDQNKSSSKLQKRLYLILIQSLNVFAVRNGVRGVSDRSIIKQTCAVRDCIKRSQFSFLEWIQCSQGKNHRFDFAVSFHKFWVPINFDFNPLSRYF